MSYLQGVIGMAGQFPESPQMHQLSESARRIVEEKAQTIIGRGTRPMIPNGLTLRQAEALAGLAPWRTNIEVAVRIGTTEAAVKKRLQEAYRKIGATDRREALIWATKNL